MAISYSPSVIKGDAWTMYNDGSGGTCYDNFPRLYITGVSLNTSTRKITISYQLYMCTTRWISSKNHNEGYNLAALEARINGSQIAWYQGSPWYQDGYTWAAYDNLEIYHDPEDSSNPSSRPAERVLFKSNSISIDWNGNPTQDVSLSVRSLQEWGWSSERWNNDSICSNVSDTLKITGLVINPTITSVSCYETNTSGTVYYSVTASQGSGSISGYKWNINGTVLSNQSGYLYDYPENTKITWSVEVNATDGGKATDNNEFYIAHITDPSITYVNYRNGARSGTTYVNDTYTGYIEYHKEYTGAVGFYSHSLEYGTTTNYGSSATTSNTGDDVTWTLIDLQPNTKYYYRIKEKDDGQTKLETTVTGNFTTTGIKPKINSISSTRGYIDYTFDINYSLDNTTLYSTDPITISMGQYNSTQGRVIYTITQHFDGSPCTVTGLESGQEYYVKTTIKDAWGRSVSSESYPTSFTTGIRAPLAVGLTKNGATVNAIGVRINYQRDPGPLQVRYSVSCSNGDEVSRDFYYDYDTRYADVNFYNLIGDTDYTFNGMVATVAGAKTATQVQFSTAMPTPIINNLDVIALDPFSIQATIMASISPSRTFLYRFSSDGGSTWTNYQSSPVYLFTNLTPETSYHIMGEAKALHEASQTSDAITRRSVTCTTPADQASVRLKQNDSWQHGKVWFKKDGEWVKAKKVYIKDNGIWRINNNN